MPSDIRRSHSSTNRIVRRAHNRHEIGLIGARRESSYGYGFIAIIRLVRCSQWAAQDGIKRAMQRRVDITELLRCKCKSRGQVFQTRVIHGLASVRSHEGTNEARYCKANRKLDFSALLTYNFTAKAFGAAQVYKGVASCRYRRAKSLCALVKGIGSDT